MFSGGSKGNIGKKRVKRFTEEITEVFEQLDVWLSFIIFDPRKLPKDVEDFTKYGVPELDKLSERYGEATDIDPILLKLE